MKTLYEIIGVGKEGNRVRLTLKQYEIVKEKLNTQDIIADPFKIINQLKFEAIKDRDPESITVPVDEWKKHKWNINGCVVLEILPNEDIKK